MKYQTIMIIALGLVGCAANCKQAAHLAYDAAVLLCRDDVVKKGIENPVQYCNVAEFLEPYYHEYVNHRCDHNTVN